MEALERDRSPRWPTNMTDIIWKLYCKKLTTTRGPANCICLFNSTIIPALSMHLSSCSGLWWIRGDSRLDLDSSSTSISSCFKIIDSASWRRIFWNGRNCVLINCTCQSCTKLGWSTIHYLYRCLFCSIGKMKNNFWILHIFEQKQISSMRQTFYFSCDIQYFYWQN